MTIARTLLTAVAGAMLLAAPAWADKNNLAISEAWVREAPPQAKVMAGYLTIANHHDHPLVLTRVTSPYFHEVQLHETYEQAGRTGMRRVPKLTIPAGGTLRLAPGGHHLMLMNPKRELLLGEKVPLVFDFGKDGKASYEVMIRSAREMRGKAKPASPAPEHHEHHEHHGEGHHH